MERPLTQDLHTDGTPLALDEYERTGGYQTLRKALLEMSPQDITNVVKQSGLAGRGGAAFPTGSKWSFVPMGPDAPRPKYLVANADEMEPGTFKDRLLLEYNPHQLIEGMILASYAIEASVSFVFLRWEYKVAGERIERAIAEAYQAGYLGKNILGSKFDLELHLHVSGGRYMAGEETGLLNALEGKRANPRSKPPFPQTSGLWGKPTIVNNVETLSNVPHIIDKGAAWFQGLSLTDEPGTKIFGVSGKVNHPGLWELPLGTPMQEIINEYAGGMRQGLTIRGVLPGGASTDFLTPENLNVPMDFKSVQKLGSRLGTGTMIVMDDKTCPVGMVLNLEHFFAQESCGWCTPCWAGTQYIERTLHAIENGEGQIEDLDRLEAHTWKLGPGNTYCAFAPGAVEPLQSALKYYRADFEEHIKQKHCPWR
ncbi:MAG: NADH-quinone oxidoreductase subunit NuoF [Chloroflexi bacterium]|nr:NADH-quinone oxidoreductase subunit NuoF [Chloroflexota bacterium]